MSDREAFLAWVTDEFAAAERAFLSGDASKRREIWSRIEPISVLGAWRNAVGREAVVEAFELVADSFADCSGFELELISFDVIGDAAFTVGYERISTLIDGRPRTFTLRVTQLYRLEPDGWRVVHRHADTAA